MNKEHKSNFIVQAGILAMAGIIVRIIGILYRSPLVMIIGDEGNGYYNTAYQIYTIILLVSSYSIPSAISKVIAARLELGEYGNAHRLFWGSIVYVIIVGGIASIICFLFADGLVGHNSSQVLRIFAPTIFFSGLLGCLRGYFQAHKTMMETSLSQIIEQIINAVISISAAYILMGMVAGASETTQAIYGAMGSALGTGSGVVTALLIMLTFYIRKRSSIMEKIQSDNSTPLKGGEVAKILLQMVTPVVLSTCIYNLSTASNLKIYQYITETYSGMDEATSTTMYGLFSGKAMQIINIPIALASAMSAALIPVIAGSYERKSYEETRGKIASAIKVTMLIAIPSAVGLFILSKPVTMLLYPQKMSIDTVSLLIKTLAIAVIFYCLSTLSNGILQGTGFVNRPVVHAAIALVIQAAFLTLALLHTNLNLYALCIANILYSFMMCIMNGMAMRQKLEYIQEIKRTFILPLCSALVMGIFAFIVYKAFLLALGDLRWSVNAVMLGIDIVISGLVYFVCIIKFGAITSDELTSLPKGRAIKKMAAKLHYK